MKHNNNKFYFVSNCKDIIYNETTNPYVVILKSNIISEKELLEEYSIKLKFPSYFGFNWDALWDCLSSLENIEQKTIIIYHEEIPKLAKEDLKIYLEILYDSVVQWKKYEEHNFEVYFNLKDYNEIQQIIG